MASDKILVVDDSRTYLAFVKATLEKDGYQVLQSSDIWISRVVHTEHPDLILMDVSLGASQGTCAVSAMRKWDFGKDLKIYLHSAQTDEELDNLAKQCGANGYIKKDGNAYQLSQQVGHILSSQKPFSQRPL